MADIRPMRAWLAVLIGLVGLPGYAEGWHFGVHTGTPTAGICPYDDAETGHFACFSVDCAQGRGMRLGIDIGGGGHGDTFSGALAVDGRAMFTLHFARQPESRWVAYRTPPGAPGADDILGMLGAGREAWIEIDTGTTRDRFGPIMLQGALDAVAGVAAACGAAPSRPSPATDPERFVAFDGRETPETEAEARRVLADELMANDAMLAEMGRPRDQTVRATIAAWPDGRRIMVAHIEHSTTVVYGESGAGTSIMVAQGGSDWALQLGTTRLVVWADLVTPGLGGWPDLWVQHVRGGFNIPYDIWRWNGTAYVHVGNVD
jgi:hypothetical protein